MPPPKFASAILPVLLLFLVRSWAQTAQPGSYVRHQIEAIADNDFWLSTDRYYTTGTFLKYRKQLQRDDSLERARTLTVGLEQLLYTPSDIRSDNTIFYDRPYAGFLGISGEWTTVENQDVISVRGLIGIAGPSSGAEWFQNLFHENGGIDTPPWTDQIADSFHLNLYAHVGREWFLQESTVGWALAFRQYLAMGTKDIYVHPEVGLYFGRRNRTFESSAYRQIGSLKDEVFALLRVGYRYVIHDAMLEGNFSGDDSVFLVDAKTHLLKVSLEWHWRWGRNDFMAGYHYGSPEAASTEAHAYVSMGYARGFN